MANVGHSFMLPGVTEHNMIGKIDCSLDPGLMSRCA